MTAMNDWRTSTAYQYVLTVPASCWAWEFLRRNSDYQADAAGQRDEPASAEGAGDWGLHSPGGSGQERG